MLFGYHGKILHVDLNKNSLDIETPSDEFYRKYCGGSAMGLYYLLRNTPANIDALDPRNTLALMISALTGTPISGQSRVTAVAKSPLTNAVGDSESGGFFPAELKFSGFDGIVITGKAKNPVYLWIHDGVPEIREAKHLWGKKTAEVERIIKSELGDEKIRILQAGIAGENGVRFAALISNANRANGRTGMGAVMGSKNLKAIAVRGKMRPQIAEPDKFKKLARWGAKNFPESDIYGMGLLGTAEIIGSQNEKGGLPTRNWQSGTFEGWRAIDGKTMAETILVGRDTCYACTVRCKRVVQVNDDQYPVDPVYGGPEYETLATFGSYCGVDNLAAVAYANQLCNAYGLDTISTGATIAFAMDCFEQGIIDENDTDGLSLKFGNADAMVALVEKIAKREGFGNVLADGSYKAAQILGKGAEDLVVAVKGLELPAHMPQVKRSLGLIYAVNPFGADHQSSEHDPSYLYYPERMAQIGLTNPQPVDVLNEEKVRYALTTEYLYSAMDSVDVCQFVFGPAWQLYDTEQLVGAIQATTGWNLDVTELIKLGERRLNMMRVFNAREGFSREQDRLPKKLSKALVGGASDGELVTEEEIEKAKDIYYQLAGWNIADGIPTTQKLHELDLEWLVELL